MKSNTSSIGNGVNGWKPKNVCKKKNSTAGMKGYGASLRIFLVRIAAINNIADARQIGGYCTQFGMYSLNRSGGWPGRANVRKTTAADATSKRLLMFFMICSRVQRVCRKSPSQSPDAHASLNAIKLPRCLSMMTK